MSAQELQENFQTFMKLMQEKPPVETEQVQALLNYYIEQNIILLNDILSISIEKFKHLQNKNTVNDIICTQAHLNSEISKKVALSSRRFLDTTLGDIGDYNEWLKTHCDLATD